MAKTFLPTAWEIIDASEPHPANTQYKVSVGYEVWGNETDPPVYVSKIQMVYDGAISGRKSPSFPVGSDDFAQVSKAMNKLLTQLRNK